MQNAGSEYNYRVVTVEKTTPPDGLGGNNWYRYVIQNGNSLMECKKSGTLKEVTAHADEVAEQINTRNTWGARKKAPSKQAK